MLTTDWITIGTAGPTIDGRKISEQLLTEAAEDYDPEEYTAVISSDHLLWMYGNFGRVDSLRTSRDKKDRLTLQAKIVPNGRMIEMNKQGQRLFTSMELTDDFAGSGRGYLMGLAVTDEPASIGTSRLQFSKQQPAPFLMNTPEPFRIDSPKPESNDETVAETGDQDEQGFRRFMKTIWHCLSTNQLSPQPVPLEDDDMTEEQFNSLKSLHEQQLAALQELTTLAKQKDSDNGKGDNGNADDDNSDSDNETGDMKAAITAMGQSINELKTQFSDALKGQQPGTHIPASTGSPESAETFI